MSSSAPPRGFVAVTPHATNTFQTCRALYVGVTGDITAYNRDGTPVLFTAVQVGILPIQTSRITAVGTTAAGIVALY